MKGANGMSYEEEIAYLRKELKKSEDKFREAEQEGYETDANVWENDMENLGRQIYLYEQASKADEYEAKAKAFDAYHSIISNHIEQQYSHNKHDMVKRFVKIHDEFESGEYS